MLGDRDKYLFLFAEMCGLSPVEVDALPFVDFLLLVDGIKHTLAEQRRAAG